MCYYYSNLHTRKLGFKEGKYVLRDMQEGLELDLKRTVCAELSLFTVGANPS